VEDLRHLPQVDEGVSRIINPLGFPKKCFAFFGTPPGEGWGVGLAPQAESFLVLFSKKERFILF